MIYLLRTIFIVVSLTAMSGCVAGLTPDLRTGLQLSPDGRSLIANSDILRFKVSIYDQFVSIGTNDVYVSFLVNVQNISSRKQKLSKDSFFLIDQHKHQYQVFSAEDLMAVVESRYNYMLPYPFVGYYYSNEEMYPTVLGDSLSNSDPYRLLKTASTLDSVILPGADIEAILYFPLDVSDVDRVELQIFSSPETGTASPDFVFPFSVEK